MKSEFGTFKKFVNWLGIGADPALSATIARRNMHIVGVGAVLVGLFAAMITFCVFTGAPCPVDGFDAAAYADPATTFRYRVTCAVALALLVGIALFAFFYVRRRWTHPGIATFITALFAFIAAMLWGIAESGVPIAEQLLIFASIEFLVSGLLIFTPLVSLAYFILVFSLFATMLGFSGGPAERMYGDLAYLAMLDIGVSVIMYSLFRANAMATLRIAEKSRRDELTGAKNRHYLRDDFPAFIGKDMFIMLCDIDNFKHYNDDYDHDVGDRLLVAFSDALREVFGDECIYRYGGDEFLVVSPDFNEQDFLTKVDRCVAQLKREKIGGIDAHLTFSGGYVHGKAHDETDFRNLMHTADKHLLATKQSGKAHVSGSAAH